MPDDYYDEDGEAMPSTETPEKEEVSQQSALVPKSFFAGKKGLEVGDTEVVKVLRIMDDEVEIECIKERYEEEAPEQATVPEEADMMAE